MALAFWVAVYAFWLYGFFVCTLRKQLWQASSQRPWQVLGA